MPRLKDRNKQTPGGHKFYDPILKYRSQPWASIDQIAQGLVQARLGNPALTQQHGWSTEISAVTNEVDQTIARQCQQMGWGQYIVDDIPQQGGEAMPPNFPRRQLPQSQRFLGARLRNVAVAAPMIVDFIKSKNEAVPIEVATQRANVCRTCVYNEKPNSLLDIFTTTASEAIRKGVETMRGLKLELPNSDELGVCSRCSCPLKLKLFFPIERIREKLSTDIQAELPDYCWILNGQ